MAQVPVIRKEDNRKGIISAVAFFLVVLFLLFFIKYHEPDPPKVTVPIPITMAASGIEDFEVSNAGGGTPSPSVNPTPEVQQNPAEQPTQEESSVTVPTGNGDNESNTSSQTQTQANPFSGAGSGGSGSAGSGSGFGSDVGPGSGSGEPGTGAAGNRVRLSNLTTNPTTKNDDLCTIALKLTVDSRGKVVAASFIRNNSTASNQALIDEVIELVKKEVRYKERPGSRNETAYYTVTVQPG